MSILILDFDNIADPKFVYKTCGGKNLTPVLKWDGVPKSTKSLAIVLHDPDAPVKGGWIHWIIYNIPPSTKSIGGDQYLMHLPEGTIVAKNSFGETGYGGPCPPPGKIHNYNMTVFALNKKLDADLKNDPRALLKAIQNSAIESSTVTKKYGR